MFIITLSAIVILIFSIIAHEIAHGAMAERLGDPTARLAGRLTLNPLKHIDLMGSVFLPIMLILFNANMILGWAKPVPINPFNFRDKKYGAAKSALAGPLANICIAVVFGLLVRFLPLSGSMFGQNILMMFSYITWINLLLAFFNLTPLPPLDGSYVLFAFLPKGLDNIKLFLSQHGFFILLFYIFFLFQFFVPLLRIIFYFITGASFV